MKHVEFTRGTVLGPDKTAIEGEVHEVDDHFARILVHSHAARVVAGPKVPKAPEPEVPKAAKKEE